MPTCTIGQSPASQNTVIYPLEIPLGTFRHAERSAIESKMTFNEYLLDAIRSDLEEFLWRKELEAERKRDDEAFKRQQSEDGAFYREHIRKQNQTKNKK